MDILAVTGFLTFQNLLETERGKKMLLYCQEILSNKYRIVSNCGPLSNCAPPQFLTKRYIMICSKSIFFSFETTISSVGHRTCSYTMLFAVSQWYIPIFLQNINLNLTFWYFKLWLPLKNRFWPLGQQFETIRYIEI